MKFTNLFQNLHLCKMCNHSLIYWNQRLLNKQASYWWFKSPWHSCNIIISLSIFLQFDQTILCTHRADSRFAPSQWETALLCNDVSHWSGANIESALYTCRVFDGQYTYETGIISCMHPANERRRYNVTSSLIGWAHLQNDPCWHAGVQINERLRKKFLLQFIIWKGRFK